MCTVGTTGDMQAGHLQRLLVDVGTNHFAHIVNVYYLKSVLNDDEISHNRWSAPCSFASNEANMQGNDKPSRYVMVPRSAVAHCSLRDELIRICCFMTGSFPAAAGKESDAISSAEGTIPPNRRFRPLDLHLHAWLRNHVWK